MVKQIGALVALVLLTSGAFAAGYSNTEFSGQGFSNSITVGGSNDVEIYSGFAVSLETAPQVFSSRIDTYGGIATDTSTFVEVAATTSSFEGTAINNGLVGRTEQVSESATVTVGVGTATSLDVRAGQYAEISIVGEQGNGIVGGQVGGYINTDYSATASIYGSSSQANTYSVNSYTLD
jgi:hypothetical protein